MLFLGTTFFSGRHTLDPSPTLAQNINKVSLENCAADQLFITKDTTREYGENYDSWDFDTVLNATFNDGTLNAGNSGFSLQNTEYILIKVRKHGEINWTTIYSKKINAIEDFKIAVNDYYRPSNTYLEYIVVSVCNGIENAYVINEIRSEFNGMFICDKDNIYGTLYNLDFADTSVPINSNVLELYNKEYPIVVSNGTANYEQGSVEGTFIKFNQDDMTVDIAGGIEYRNDAKKWLNNKKPKILKFHDGRIWMISITGSVNDSGEEINDLRKLSFEWTEIGNVNNMETLYEAGLSDVGKEWWY